MYIASVTNQKGGVGKTTATMNIASELAQHSRVLVVDVDPQQSASEWAELAGESLPFDFASESDPSVLARLREASDYDTIFVDTPGSIENSDLLAAVLDSSDFVILPMEAEVLSVKPLVTTITTLVEPRNLPYKVLLSRYDARDGRVGREQAEAMLDAAEIPRFKTAIRRYGIHSAAPGNGTVVSTYAATGRRDANAIADFKDVALEFSAFRANGRNNS